MKMLKELLRCFSNKLEAYAGYTGYAEVMEARQYIGHIRPHGEKKFKIAHNPQFKARRWVVEAAHSWLKRFCKLLVRFEKKADNYLGLLQFVCALIVWRKFMRIHA